MLAAFAPGLELGLRRAPVLRVETTASYSRPTAAAGSRPPPGAAARDEPDQGRARRR
jgi:hypothetical protein